jgi:ankyrin repeat protein
MEISRQMTKSFSRLSAWKRSHRSSAGAWAHSLVDNNKIDINKTDLKGRTPLYFAYQYGNNGIVEFLKTIGANINNEPIPRQLLIIYIPFYRRPVKRIEFEKGMTVEEVDKVLRHICKFHRKFYRSCYCNLKHVENSKSNKVLEINSKMQIGNGGTMYNFECSFDKDEKLEKINIFEESSIYNDYNPFNVIPFDKPEKDKWE